MAVARQLASVPFEQAQAHFAAQLRADPAARQPALPAQFGETARLREWKMHCRAFDAARVELGLTDSRALHDRNAAIRPALHGRRIVVFERFI